jgi:SnoaL-like domain
MVEAAPWRTIRHVCGNMRFVSRGPKEAEGITVLTVFMVAGSDASTTIPYSVGEDHDRFVRTEQGWKLVSRHWVELFSRGDSIKFINTKN